MATKQELETLVQNLSTENSDLKLRLEQAESSLALAQDFRPESGRNYACLDGVLYDIIHRTMAKEFINDFYKRYVDEQNTVLVIPKIGG
jgi:hypothetical protein